MYAQYHQLPILVNSINGHDPVNNDTGSEHSEDDGWSPFFQWPRAGIVQVLEVDPGHWNLDKEQHGMRTGHTNVNKQYTLYLQEHFHLRS